MAKQNPNDWHIEVYPRRAGDFGGISMSGIKYTEKEAENLQVDIQNEIRRHINGVANTSVVYDGWLCEECENEYSTKKEAEECCKS